MRYIKNQAYFFLRIYAQSFRGCRDIYVLAINTGFARIYA